MVNSTATLSCENSLFVVESLLAKGMHSAVSFKLQPSQTWQLTGLSGTGKSQLLKALADLIEHKGKTWLNQKSQVEMCPENWRQQVMYFSAETAWWHETISEHFIIQPTKEQLEEIGLTTKILAHNADDCSSGEKQRLALLRGLNLSPSILLLDEITANLDIDNTLNVECLLQKYLHELGKKRAIIWISHDVMQTKRLFSKAQTIQLTEVEKV